MASGLNQENEDKIAGLDSQLDEIYKQITIPRSIDQKLRKQLGLRNVKGIILHGPPGTGKTLLARNLAKRLGCFSYNKISAVSLLDKYYGSTESKLREIFEHEPGELHMVILDEIDSICPIRTSGMNDSKFYTGVTNQLLSLMDGMDSDPDVLVVGTTNKLDSIDPAILRAGRFDLHLDVALPDEKARESIFRVYTEHLIENSLMERYDMENVISKTNGFSGADIENCVRKATTLALYRHKENEEAFLITQEDLLNSLNIKCVASTNNLFNPFDQS
jgi:vesicle-fusing ATPase